MPQILLHHSAVPAERDERLLGPWLALLPPDKAGHVARIKDAAARAASVMGIALLHDCARAAGLALPPPGTLRFPEGGKPAWPGGPDFSISHAAGRVACALAPPGIEVGLDIEPAGAAERAGLGRVASDAERLAMAQAGLTATELWTAKEAVAKLTGAGIAGVADVRVGAHDACYAGRRYVLARPDIAPGIRCAVASSAEVTLQLREVAPADILR